MNPGREPGTGTPPNGANAQGACLSELGPACPDGTGLTAETQDDGLAVVHWFWDDGCGDRTVCGELAAIGVYLDASPEVLASLHRPPTATSRPGPVLCPMCQPMLRALHTVRDHHATAAPYYCGNGCTATVPDVGDTTTGACPCSRSGAHTWVNGGEIGMRHKPVSDGGDLAVGLVRIVYLGGRTADLRLPASMPGEEARQIAENVSAYSNVASVTAVCASYTPGKVSVWRYTAGHHIPPVDVVDVGEPQAQNQLPPTGRAARDGHG